MTKMFMTPAMKKALTWFVDLGGDGMLTKKGQMMVAGKVGLQDGSTWLCLISFDFIESNGPYRFRVTEEGQRYVDAL